MYPNSIDYLDIRITQTGPRRFELRKLAIEDSDVGPRLVLADDRVIATRRKWSSALRKAQRL